MQHMRVFLSSPGDVLEEREMASALIQNELANDPLLRGKVTFEVVRWDDRDAEVPLDAGKAPQASIDETCPVADCDVVLVFLWSRMGTPQRDRIKQDGTPFGSGTEWEFHNALRARGDGEWPAIYVYKKTVVPAYEATDPELDEKRRQYEAVQAFIGSIRKKRSVRDYSSLDDLKQTLRGHLRWAIRRRLEQAGNAQGGQSMPPPPAFQTALQRFRDEYLASDENGAPVPFGGRDAELARLDTWLADDKAPCRYLLTAPAGRGKSALLVRWLETLRETGRTLEGAGGGTERWHVAFVPISIRFGTNRPEQYHQALAEQLGRIAGKRLKPVAVNAARDYANHVHELLTGLGTDGVRVLVVLDGLDEAPEGRFNADLIPKSLKSHIRVLVSARWQLGDVDGEGWRRKLGWVGAQRCESFELPPLCTNDVGDVLIKMGAPVDDLGRDPHLLERLVTLTEGDPLLLYHYARSLWDHATRNDVRLSRDDLDTLKPGFGAYFKLWLEYQKQAWQDAGLDVDQHAVDAVLMTLAFAHGPLEASDLGAVLDQLPRAPSFTVVETLLEPLHRFVIGGGESGHGYVLAHPKIGEYLREQRFASGAVKMKRAFVAWGRSVVEGVNADPATAANTPVYLLQYHRHHLAEAGASVADFMALVEDGWRRSWEQYEGGQQGFSEDVAAAWHRARDAGPLAELGAQLRCGLTLSSISSLGSNMPSALLVHAVKHAVLTHRQAAHLAGFMTDELDQVRALVGLATAGSVPDDEKSDLLRDALTAAKAIGDEALRADALEGLAPHLDPEQRTDVLVAVEAIGDEDLRAVALAGLAPHLGPEQLADALAAAKAIGDEDLRAVALAGLAPHLGPEQLADVLAAVAAIRDDGARASILMELADRAGPDQRESVLQEALASAKAVGEEGARARALSALAPHLDTEQRANALQDALASAKAIDYAPARANALSALMPHLDTEQRASVLQDALASARALDLDLEYERPRALVGLAPYLDSDQLADALAAAETIRDEDARADALAGLAPRLGPTQLADALAAAKAIEYWRAKAKALRGLAPHLDSDQLADALAAAKAIRDEYGRAATLGDLAPCMGPAQLVTALDAVRGIGDVAGRALALMGLALALDSEDRANVLQDALAAAKAIADEGARADVLMELTELAPHLGPEQLGDVLATVKAIGKDGARASILMELALHAAPDQRESVLQEALAGAKAVGEEGARARALSALAPHLDTEQRTNALQDALASAKAIDYAPARANALSALMPHLDTEQRASVLQDALASARALDPEYERPRALVGLAPYLDTEQRACALQDTLASLARASHLGAFMGYARLADTLTAAKALGEECERADAVKGVASRVDTDRRARVLQDAVHDALAAATAITYDEYERARALLDLAPHLDSDQLADALAAAKAIGDEYERAKALAGLAPHLGAALLADALEAAKAIGDTFARTCALVDLAPHLDPGDALAAVKDIGDEYERARALLDLAPRLDNDQLAEAIVAAKAIRDESRRVVALTGLAPHIDAEQLTDAFAMFLKAVLEATARVSRPVFLESCEVFLPAIRALGGTAPLLALHRAIQDTASWYP